MSPQRGWDLLEPCELREAAEVHVHLPQCAPAASARLSGGYPPSDRACNEVWRRAAKRTDREGQVATKELSAHLP